MWIRTNGRNTAASLRWRTMTAGVSIRLLAIAGDRRLLRPLNPAWPERLVDVETEIMIRGVVVFAGREV